MLKNKKTHYIILFIILISFVFVGCSQSLQLIGSGSTAISPFIMEWVQDYVKEKNIRVTYNSIGSGGGISNLKQNIVDFAGSDKPLNLKDRNAIGLVQFPLDVSAIVVVANIPGVADNQLVLNGKVLAGIYMGKIKKWNDPAILQLNPNLSLPNVFIVTVHRSDGSGTTYNFTNYLSHVSEVWNNQIGTGTVVNWKGSSSYGAKGNAGVTAQVKGTKNSIGYVDWIYALEEHLHKSKLYNKKGNIVGVSDEALKVSAATFDWKVLAKNQFASVPTNPLGENAWPITMVSFGMIRKDAKNKQMAWNFFKFGYKDTAPMIRLKFQPIPKDIVRSIIVPYMQRNLGVQ